MHAAFVLFDRLTALDFVGAYDPLTRLRSMGFVPDFTWDLCARQANVVDDRGLILTAGKVGEPLSGYDLLVVPGGYGTRDLQTHAGFLAWLRTADAVPLKAAVCTGSLLLGAAGFLAGKPATTHPAAFADLGQYAQVDTTRRVVDAGNVVTARGVSAGIDLGLHLVQRLAGVAVAKKVATQMDYPWFNEAG